MREIACIVIPYFVAAVERLTNPVNSDKPLVLCTSDKVYSVAETAAKAGIFPGMPLRKVRTLCPEADLRAPRTVLYRETFDNLLDILSDFTHRIESAEPVLHSIKNRAKNKPATFGTDDGLSAVIYLDLEQLKAQETDKLAVQILRCIEQRMGLTALIGIAQGKFPARIAAACTTVGEVKRVPLGEEALFLADMPVSALPVEDLVIDQLRMLGIQTFTQLAQLPISALNAQFGKKGLMLKQLASGEDNRPVVYHKPRGIIHVQHQFESSIYNRQTLEAVLAVLADELSEKLDAEGSMTSYIELGIQTETTAYERFVTFSQPASGSGHLLNTLLDLLNHTQLTTAVRSLNVTLSALTPSIGRQLDLFVHEKGRESRLRSNLKDVINKYGAECFQWIDLHPEARLSERAFDLRPAS